MGRNSWLRGLRRAGLAVAVERDSVGALAAACGQRRGRVSVLRIDTGVRGTLRSALVLAVSLALSASACSGGADVGRDELASVVRRDGVPFDGQAIPDDVLERLGKTRVLVLGETHHLREHWELTAALVRRLHAHGFRQLLVEQPQMADWWLDGYAGGGAFDPGWQVPPNWEWKLAAIRELNTSLPPEERVHVRAIDVNEEHFGGARAFRAMLQGLVSQLGETGPVEPFLRAPYATREAEIEAVEALRTSLESRRSKLVRSWGPEWYETVLEMVDVERASIDIRFDRVTNDDRAARAREELIKQLVDARLAAAPGGAVINIGGHHAQKEHLLGTRQEWLGDYLAHRSPVVSGSVTVVSVVSAKTVLEPGSSGTPFDVLTSSPEHELFRLLAESWPRKTVFLPLDDPVFAEGRVAVNYEESISSASLAEQFDAVLQYGLAHRMPAA